ncbi:uncharacterized protein LOC133202950 [Saccostrea echinata]|uniref:uncharacterized protein LOC133202950 n=1 Tax=Saccostrea echinata TaxID=191078 RepID=UPI002A80E311|nr:uncharacterized protein LOC133202950 [Saccostrea echinata]
MAGFETIFGTLSLTQGSEYKYMNDNNETCIDAKMDVLFTLSNGNGTVKFDGNDFTVKSGDCANEGEYQAVLNLGNSNEDLLALTFNTQPDLSVNMSSMFIFAPFEFFPGTPIATATNLLDTGDLKFGSNTQLYQCESTQRMTLTGELEGTTYTMNMDMSNVQIQAFNIKNGNLSIDVFVCSADQMTTVAQETTKATSEPTQPTTEPSASNVTTEQTTVEPSNVTSGAPTSAPPIPPFPPKSRYEVTENKIVCLIMEGSFQLKVTYTTKDNKTASTIVVVPVSSNVIVTGTCASGNENSSSLTIRPKDGEIKSLTFNFEIMNGKSNLISWFVDVKIPDAMECKYQQSDLNYSVTDKVELSSPKLYYKCDKGGNISDSALAFMYRDLKVQAFNLEDEKFSENGVYCEADFGPIPVPGCSSVNIYSVLSGNNTCVVFKGSIQFYIPYISKTGITTEVISLPAVYNVSGKCNTTLNGLYSQQMVIRFYDAWILTIYFSSDKHQETDPFTAEAGVDNYISQIELKYDYNNVLYKDAVDSILGKEMSVVAPNLNKLTTNYNKSYKCKKETTIRLQNGLSMVTKDLQYQAFKTGQSADFSTAVNCERDEDDKHYLLYIAIGAAVGGCLLVVVVLVTVHVINKRRKYEQLTL